MEYDRILFLNRFQDSLFHHLDLLILKSTLRYLKDQGDHICQVKEVYLKYNFNQFEIEEIFNSKFRVRLNNIHLIIPSKLWFPNFFNQIPNKI